jgi:hypothetical protein
MTAGANRLDSGEQLSITHFLAINLPPDVRTFTAPDVLGIGHAGQLLPAADMPRCTRWSAVGHKQPPALQKRSADLHLKARHTGPTSIGYR